MTAALIASYLVACIATIVPLARWQRDTAERSGFDQGSPGSYVLVAALTCWMWPLLGSAWLISKACAWSAPWMLGSGADEEGQGADEETRDA